MSSPNTAYYLSSPQREESLNTSTGVPTTNRLDLSGCPHIFVSATHFETVDLHAFEDELIECKANLTYDVFEAKVILSKVTKKARIRFDLRSKGILTEDAGVKLEKYTTEEPISSPAVSPRKRKRKQLLTGQSRSDAVVIDDSSTESEGCHEVRQYPPQASHDESNSNGRSEPMIPTKILEDPDSVIDVVSIAWFRDSKRLGQLQPLSPYVNYRGRCVEREAAKKEVPTLESPSQSSEKRTIASPSITVTALPIGDEILERAKEDSPAPVKRWDRFGRRKFGLSTPSANPASWEAGHGAGSQRIPLIRTLSTENDIGYASDLPEMPDWVKKGVRYACQRVTPGNTPNDEFISLLKKIKLARLLTNDEIGVRAYSTSIASIAAYHHKIHDPGEILALPGCDAKIANLFGEWMNTGKIRAVEDLDADTDLQVLRLFYEIWGVGATTAREFYYDRGWSDLDDIVEYGWSTLSRVQQIGLKYYDEFQDPIPRAEVERIGHIVHEHAVRVRDEGIQTMIVGGYRRGKVASGDVDIIVSHPEEGQTLNIVNDIVSSLEGEEWITHTLYLSLHNSNRGQATLPFRTGGGGHGFDTLDKALVVWQDPGWPAKERDLAENPSAKNPNIHRRVDIIISPWRTVGCAVVGWSGGTTFERDLRRYAKHAHSWKFDSSGVRDRRNGEVVDMEGYYHWKGKQGIEARAKTMEEAERRVFESMGITYRAPWERCTH